VTKGCARCARRFKRSGYRRRCSDCRTARRAFHRAAMALVLLEVDPSAPDRAPAFEAFRPWLYVSTDGGLHVLEHDPEGRVQGVPWAT
jgi:hypothetical protein